MWGASAATRLEHFGPNRFVSHRQRLCGCASCPFPLNLRTLPIGMPRLCQPDGFLCLASLPIDRCHCARRTAAQYLQRSVVLSAVVWAYFVSWVSSVVYYLCLSALFGLCWYLGHAFHRCFGVGSTLLLVSAHFCLLPFTPAVDAHMVGHGDIGALLAQSLGRSSPHFRYSWLCRPPLPPHWDRHCI